MLLDTFQTSPKLKMKSENAFAKTKNPSSIRLIPAPLGSSSGHPHCTNKPIRPYASTVPAPQGSSSGHPHCTQSENRPRHGEENVVSPIQKRKYFFLSYTETYLALKECEKK
jgi:hypothetical protein